MSDTHPQGGATALAAPLVLPPARWADPEGARRRVTLAHPVIDDGGRTWDAVYVRRFTTGQVAAVVSHWLDRVKADPDAPLAFPSYVDVDWNEVPAAVMSLIDDDERDAIAEVARGFLPRRFRPDPAPETNPGPSIPETGDTSAP